MATDMASACPLQQAAAGIAVVRPERFCFGPLGAARQAAISRILILDTQAHLAAMTAVMLHDAGHTARWCLDTRDALDLLEAGHRFDLLLAPALHPTVEAGLAFVRAARTHQPGLRVVLTHGSACEARSEIPDSFDRLAKPYTRARLLRKVSDVLDRT
jgi:DNA-binding NtrC family response regulator